MMFARRSSTCSAVPRRKGVPVAQVISLGRPAARVRVMVRAESGDVDARVTLPSIVVHGYSAHDVHKIIAEALRKATES